FRYLYLPAAARESLFVLIVHGTPTRALPQSLTQALSAVRNHAPFNPQGGLLMCAKLYPIGFEDFSDLLGGKPWTGFVLGKKVFDFGGPYGSVSTGGRLQHQGAYLFLGAHGRAGRFVEALHLKLQLLLDAFRVVRACVKEQQLPFLNLSSESFRVKLGDLGAG